MYKSLNYRIAKYHRYSKQFTGLYIALSNLIAVALSGIAVALGVIVYAFTSIKVDTSTNIGVAKLVGLGILFMIIGVAISFLIEGLTISNCARLRKNVDNYRSLKVKHASIEDKTDSIRLKKQQQLNDVTYAAWFSALFVLVCTSISTLAATLFWHWLLQSMPQWQAILYSTVFSAVVSITLVWTELARGLNDQLVQEAVSSTSMLHAAATASFEETTLEMLHDAQHAQIRDASTSDTFVEAASKLTDTLLDKTVSGGTGTFSAMLEKERKQQEAYELAAMKHLSEGTVMPEVDQQPINMPTVRRDKAKNIQAIRDIVADKGPDYVQQNVQEIAGKLGVNLSTMYRYLSELAERPA